MQSLNNSTWGQWVLWWICKLIQHNTKKVKGIPYYSNCNCLTPRWVAFVACHTSLSLPVHCLWIVNRWSNKTKKKRTKICTSKMEGLCPKCHPHRLIKSLTSSVDITAKGFALQTKPVDKYIVELLMNHFKSLERSSQRLIKNRNSLFSWQHDRQDRINITTAQI